MLSTWFHAQTEETIGQRTCNDNRTLALQVTRSLNHFESGTKLNHEDELKRLCEKIDSITVPNGGFIIVINPQSAKILCCSPHQAIPAEFDPTSIKLKMLSKSLEEQVDLLRSVAPNNRHRHFDGRAEIAGREHFVSVDAFLRHEDESRKISQAQADIANRTVQKQFANSEELIKNITERTSENQSNL